MANRGRRCVEFRRAALIGNPATSIARSKRTEVTEERRARVRNLSLTGARLEGPEVDGCPEVFDLRIVHDSGAVEKLSARCIWRSPGVIGVRFEEGAPIEQAAEDL